MGIRVLRGAKDASPPVVPEKLPSAADLDAVAAEAAVKEATTPVTGAIELDPVLSFRKAVPGGPTNPSYDSDKLDSTGENEKADGPLGPRGVNQPGDVMSDADRALVAKKREERLAKGMAATHSVDSTGKPKGQFATVAQGHDKHGMRLPDKIDYSAPVEAHVPMVGPRGSGVPNDTFHKK